MTLLNQGFVRTFNLQESIDAIKTLNNLAGGTITDDLIVFAGNTTNKTTLLFDISDIKNTLIEGGLAFKQSGKDSTLGNGDPITIKTYIKIQAANYNGNDDSLTVTFTEPHGITDEQFNAGVMFELIGTNFLDPISTNFSATILLNKIPYVAQKVSQNQVKLLNLGYIEETGIGNLTTTGIYNNPYALSNSLPLPVSQPQITYDTLYYVAFSNAVDTFRVATNYTKIDKINQIQFQPLTKSILFERLNKTTQENVKNLSLPIFKDGTFTFTSGSTNRDFNSNFSVLEQYLDSANFFRFKKYTSIGNETFDANELSFEGNLFTSDPDGFNNTSLKVYDPAQRVTSPGIYILDPSSTTENLVALRAYSDNTQPWKLLDNPDPTNDVLEYQVLRSNPASTLGPNSAPRTIANQQMQIGNLILKSSNPADSTKTIQLELNPSNVVSITNVNIIDTAKTTFSHKLPVVINGEEYSVCVDSNVVSSS